MPASRRRCWGRHNRLGANYVRNALRLAAAGRRRETRGVAVGNAQASDGEALRRPAWPAWAWGGWPRSRREDIAAGRLIPVLEAYNPGDLEEVHAVYVGQGGYLPLRVRAFLDFLAERVDMSRVDRSATPRIRRFRGRKLFFWRFIHRRQSR